MVNRERKIWGISWARAPLEHPYLSGVCVLQTLDGVYFSNIKFLEEFVDYVGSEFPEGIGEDRGAYIKLVQIAEDDWVVTACYADRSKAVVLWITDHKPVWVRGMYKAPKD